MKLSIIITAAAAVAPSDAALMSKSAKSDSKASKDGGVLFPKSGKDMPKKSSKSMKGEASGDDISGADVACSDNFFAPGFGTDKPNPCQGKKINIPNVPCYDDGVAAVNGQAGADVTEGKQGLLEVDFEPITSKYISSPNGLCPVNVHWHLGAEHRSEGEYDESFDDNGPGGHSRMLADKIRQGFRCGHNDGSEMFTTEYDWKYCTNMHVGETYEIHWPHSAAGACGTIWQFQTDFYDGVFCGIDDPSQIPSDLQNYVGVQAQVFTVVNDESYYFPDLMRGMIVDGGDMGTHITKYTGSTTGDGRNNDDQCSQYAPITWQVDRKCHMISASTFDKMCFDMLNQADDMSEDVYPHGSREVSDAELTANNQVWDRKRGLRKHQ